MTLKQYYLGCLAHAYYLIVDEIASTAIVVDPQRDIQKYLDDAEAFHAQIRHVFLTHFHADFVAGHLGPLRRCDSSGIAGQGRVRLHRDEGGRQPGLPRAAPAGP
jgi:hydroxyacylglutathione hydrolase